MKPRHTGGDVTYSLEELMKLLRGEVEEDRCSELQLLERFMGLVLVMTYQDVDPDIRADQIKKIGALCGINLENAILEGLQGKILALDNNGSFRFCSVDIARKVETLMKIWVEDLAERLGIVPIQTDNDTQD